LAIRPEDVDAAQHRPVADELAEGGIDAAPVDARRSLAAARYTVAADDVGERTRGGRRLQAFQARSVDPLVSSMTSTSAGEIAGANLRDGRRQRPADCRAPGPGFARLRSGRAGWAADQRITSWRFDGTRRRCGRMTGRAADAAEMFTMAGIAAVMNAYNGGDPATTE
jgi:hypothetical protein